MLNRQLGQRWAHISSMSVSPVTLERLDYFCAGAFEKVSRMRPFQGCRRLVTPSSRDARTFLESAICRSRVPISLLASDLMIVLVMGHVHKLKEHTFLAAN